MWRSIIFILTASALCAQSFSPSQILENFSLGMRTSGAGENLWQPYGGEGEGDQVLTISGGQMIDQSSQHTNCTTVKGCGIYIIFYSKGGGFVYSNTYTQHFVMSPSTFVAGTNHMRFGISCVNAVPHNTSGNNQSNNLQIGTYIRDKLSNVTTFQGQHYYHFFNLNITANQQMYIDWSAQPQHVVTVNAIVIYDPEEPGTPNATQNMQYFDGLTEWYFDTQNAGEFGWTQWANNTCTFTNFNFYTAPAGNQPEAYVAGTWIQYDGTNYEYGFSTPYNSPQNIVHDIAYSTSSMRINGWASGSSGGTVTPTSGTGYVSVAKVLSPAVAQSTNFYIAIRPHIPITAVSGSSPIQLTTYTNHLLQTGQTIIVSGLSSCSAANTTHTVTSTGANTFTLDGTSGAGCSFNSGGTFYGTEYFSEVWTGEGAASYTGTALNGPLAVHGPTIIKEQ